MDERKKVENNIIIMGIPEPDGNLREASRMSDRETVGDLLNNVLEVTVQPDEIMCLRRLGARKTKLSEAGALTADATGPRPVRITLPPGLKEEVFQATYKLKGSRYESLSIRRDLTTLERVTFNKIRDHANDLEKRDGSGKYLHRVRGPPGHRFIVKLLKEEDNQPLSKMEVVEKIKLQPDSQAPKSPGAGRGVSS